MSNDPIAVFSVLPTTTVPHPPWFYNGTDGNYPVNTTLAKQLGVTSAEVKRLSSSFGIFGKPIRGSGLKGNGYFDGDYSELDAL